MDKAENAKKILCYYMRKAWEASGLKWDSDNDAEAAGIIDDIVDGIKNRD